MFAIARIISVAVTLPGNSARMVRNFGLRLKILLCIPWSALQASFILRLGTTFPVSARAIRVQSSVIILRLGTTYARTRV